jgi:catechol 2,3-dioxygenase-like lactoylglutathione lyase family enzyme
MRSVAARIEFLSAVQLVSRDAERLVAFYRDVLGLPLAEQSALAEESALAEQSALPEHRPLAEQGEAEEPFWACTLGELHLSIRDAAEGDELGVGAVKLAFAVIDVDDVVASLEERGVALLYAPRDLGWCKMTAIRDPDGNCIELTELGDDWYRHLEKRAARPAPRVKKKLADVKR